MKAAEEAEEAAKLKAKAKAAVVARLKAQEKVAHLKAEADAAEAARLKAEAEVAQDAAAATPACPAANSCICTWANTASCSSDDGTVCNHACCCKFRGGAPRHSGNSMTGKHFGSNMAQYLCASQINICYGAT